MESNTGVDSHKAGACLLESLSDFTGRTEQCQDLEEASDCSGKLPARLKNAGYASYCLPDTKTCWVRPENEGIIPNGPIDRAGTFAPHRMLACNRSIDYSPPKEWQPGQYITNEVPIAPPPGRKSHWRVLACIFGSEGCVPSLGPVTEIDAVGVSHDRAETQLTPGVAPKSPPPHPEALNPVVNQ
jgi:hypothetical protein